MGLVVGGGDGTAAPLTSVAGAPGQRSRRRRRIEPYAWLAAGAVGVGIAAALTGSGVAYADDTTSTSSAASSDSATSGTSPKGSPSDEAGDESSGSTPDERSGDDDRATADDDSADDDDASESPDGAEDADSPEPAPGDPDTEDTDAASDGPGSYTSRATSRDASGDDTLSGTDSAAEQEATTPTSSTIEDLATAVDEPASAAVSVADSTAAATIATPDTPPVAASEVSVTVLNTTSSAPKRQSALADFLTTLFVRLQSVFFTTTPTAKSVQQVGQSSQALVTGTVGATNPDVPSKYDAGLSDPFLLPDAPTGKTLNVRDYGATSNRSWDNDATAIQKAIDAAQSGDVVYIPNGRYHIKSTITLKSGVSLTGQSRDGTVLASAFRTSPHAMIYAPAGTTNLTLSSFKITRSSGWTIKAGVRLGAEGSTQVSRIVVKDLFIEKFQRFGVQLQNAYQVLVDGNIIKNATALGGGGSGYGVIIDQSLSSNNWVRNNDIGPVIRHAILIQESAHNNLIEENRITGTVSGAIDLHGEDEYANEIRYNVISNGVRNGTSVSPNGAGIEVGEFSGVAGTEKMHDNSGPGNWIHHNVVYNYSYGLRITNDSNYTFIEDNIFHDNRGAGIQADLAPLNNLYISGNEIYNNGSGIKLYDVTNAVVQGNTVRDNDTYGIWTNAGVTGYVITGNTVTANKTNVTLGSPDGAFIAGG